MNKKNQNRGCCGKKIKPIDKKILRRKKTIYKKIKR